jgi:hypothetical protein
MIQVRYRSHATYSRQPRQVRKEATVTGSCVCSESPVPDLIFHSQPSTVRQPLITEIYLLFTTFFAGNVFLGHLYEVSAVDPTDCAAKEKHEQFRCPCAISPRENSSLGQIISGPSRLSGPVSTVGHRLPIVAFVVSFPASGTGPRRALLPDRRRKSPFRNRSVPGLHSRLDGARKRPRGSLKPRNSDFAHGSWIHASRISTESRRVW